MEQLQNINQQHGTYLGIYGAFDHRHLHGPQDIYRERPLLHITAAMVTI
jgi:hypothetical protein